MSTRRSRLAGWTVGVTLVVALTASCSSHRLLGHRPGAQGGTAPASGQLTTAPATPAATGTSGTSAGGATADVPGSTPASAAQASADLAAVAQDLAGIDAATGQADKDLSAGDYARARDDNG
jgi:hypothetical protein